MNETDVQIIRRLNSYPHSQLRFTEAEENEAIQNLIYEDMLLHDALYSRRQYKVFSKIQRRRRMSLKSIWRRRRRLNNMFKVRS